MEVGDFSFPAARSAPGSPRHRHLPFPHFAASPVWFAPHPCGSRSSSSSTEETSDTAQAPKGNPSEHQNQEPSPACSCSCIHSNQHQGPTFCSCNLSDQGPAPSSLILAILDPAPPSHGEDDREDHGADVDSPAASESSEGSHRENRSEEFIHVDDEERMDMLWEELNEELHPVPCSDVRGGKKVEFDWDKQDKVELCCVKALGMTRRSSSLVHRRRLVMMLKVLKKLFLMQKVSSSKRASSLYQI